MTTSVITWDCEDSLQVIPAPHEMNYYEPDPLDCMPLIAFPHKRRRPKLYHWLGKAKWEDRMTDYAKAQDVRSRFLCQDDGFVVCLN